MAENLPPVVGAHEIAHMLNVTRQRITQISSRPDFPAPIYTLQMGRIWLKADIVAWAERKGRNINA